MKAPQLLTIDELLADPALRNRPIIDARSPAEFAEDHLRGAINLPVLDNAERARIGTLDREQGSFAANREGAAGVSRRIAAMLEGPLADKPRDWSPIVYCWRGGSRSWSLATVLARIGWRVSLLDGGYRRFRERVVADTGRIAPQLTLRVLAGPTGVGKTRLLHLTAAAGHQVLDLEALANHRGSVLGARPGDMPRHSPDADELSIDAAVPAQPSQKAFEHLLWQALSAFDPARPVLVESESRKIGRVHLPEPMILAMRASPCIRIEAPLATRIELLRDEYQHFEEDPAALLCRLDRLSGLHADGRVQRWHEQVRRDDWDGLVTALLEQHYDPAYFRSMQRNYTGIGQASAVALQGADDAALSAAADQVGRLIAAPARPADA